MMTMQASQATPRGNSYPSMALLYHCLSESSVSNAKRSERGPRTVRVHSHNFNCNFKHDSTVNNVSEFRDNGKLDIVLYLLVCMHDEGTFSITKCREYGARQANCNALAGCYHACMVRFRAHEPVHGTALITINPRDEILSFRVVD